jgi:predicted nucleotidyltransferase
MYQQFNKYKILQVFFDNPNKKFQLRQLSRITTISLPSIKKYVEDLVKQDLISEVNNGVYKGYKSCFSQKYKMLKRNDLLLRLNESGLIKEIQTMFTPNCIIIYGSAVQGTDDERGDVDLFVQSAKKDLDTSKYEKKIKRTINILYEPNIEKIDNTLKNTLSNGIVLNGFLKVI